MAWTNKPYCSVDDVKAALDRRTDTDDDLLAGLIARAQAWIDERLGFRFQTDGTTAAPASRSYDGTDRDQLLIDRCVEVTNVVVRTWSVAQQDGTLHRSFTDEDITEDCVLGPPNRTPGFLVERLSGVPFHRGKRNVVLAGVWGEPTLPADIRRATERLAVHYALARESGYEDKVGGEYGTKTFRAGAIPDEVCEAVDRHRRRFFRS